MERIPYQELKPICKQLSSAESSTIGPVRVECELVVVSSADHTNAWKGAVGAEPIRRYFIGDHQVDVVEAAKAIYRSSN